MPKHGKKAERINAYFKLRHGKPKEGKSSVVPKKKGYKKRK